MPKKRSTPEEIALETTLPIASAAAAPAKPSDSAACRAPRPPERRRLDQLAQRPARAKGQREW